MEEAEGGTSSIPRELQQAMAHFQKIFGNGGVIHPSLLTPQKQGVRSKATCLCGQNHKKAPVSRAYGQSVASVELPVWAGFCVYSRTHLTFGEGVPGICVGQRTSLRSQSLLPPLGGGSRSQSHFPILHTKHRLRPFPSPLLAFAWLRGLMLRGELLPTWPGFLFVGNGQ